MTETATEAVAKPTVQEAWSAVMGEVTHLGKDSRNASQGFNFRGIDALMNLVGPVLRKHGVSVIPSTKSIERRDFTTNKGTVMRETVVDVHYTIIGPAGDEMVGSALGEASDAGDKSTPKAMSVAYRTFLLQALCLPTDEPDPDETSVERGVVDPGIAVAQKTADGLSVAVDLAKVLEVRSWAASKNILDTQVVDPEGNSLPLQRLFDRVEAHLGGPTADEKAEQVLRDSLGATEVTEEAKS